jgi:protein-disulfide isomerase
VQRDLQEAREARIQGTSSFIINEQRLTGPIPLDDFEQVEDDELRKVEGA